MFKYLGIMYRIKNQLPFQVHLQLYHRFVQSHLNYCSLIWRFAAKSHIDSVFSKQKSEIRAVIQGYVNFRYYNSQIPTHTKSSFYNSKFLTVHGVIIKNGLTFMHKVRHFPQSLPESTRDTTQQCTYP